MQFTEIAITVNAFQANIFYMSIYFGKICNNYMIFKDILHFLNFC